MEKAGTMRSGYQVVDNRISGYQGIYDTFVIYIHLCAPSTALRACFASLWLFEKTKPIYSYCISRVAYCVMRSACGFPPSRE
jgi:hypothetical protein